MTQPRFEPLSAVEVESHLESIKEAIAPENRPALKALIYAYTFAQHHHGEEYRRYVEAIVEAIESPSGDQLPLSDDEIDEYAIQQAKKAADRLSQHRAAMAAMAEEIARWVSAETGHPGWSISADIERRFCDLEARISLKTDDRETGWQIRLRLRFLMERHADIAMTYETYQSCGNQIRPLIEKLGQDGWLTGLHLEG